MNNKYLFIIIFLLILFPPNINNIRLNVKIIIALIGIIIICNVNEGFGNIDAEALQNMASLYNSSTGVLKVNNLEASGNITAKGNIKSDKISTITADGYISTNLVKPTVKTEHLNILGPNDQTISFTKGQYKYIDLINTDVHIAGNRKPVIAGQEPDKYKLYVSIPSEFRKEIGNITTNDITANGNITTEGDVTANRFIANQPCYHYKSDVRIGRANDAPFVTKSSSCNYLKENNKFTEDNVVIGGYSQVLAKSSG